MSNTTITRRIFTIHDNALLKAKVLNWIKQFDTFCFLDSNNYKHDLYASYEMIAGAGSRRYFESNAANALDEFDHFAKERSCWLFGHLGYDVQMEQASRQTTKRDRLSFPDIAFFEPEIILELSGNTLHISATDANIVYDEIIQTEIDCDLKKQYEFDVKSKITKQQYLPIINALQKHIQRGDCYEINFCHEFFVENAALDPFELFKALNEASPNPFAAFYRLKDKWLFCASPERFLKKSGAKIYSQPIKGTLVRNNNAILQDIEQNKLRYSAKDKAENVMIVDLVRNDLSRICEDGSVVVTELFGIYSFPQLHQMISTIVGNVIHNTSFSGIMKATFPMGSMTGAPKIRVMELIAQYEKSKRGIFSGALGYITPAGDFDLNVVIRSIMYNAATKYLSYQVGSGITIYSDAASEWEECNIKAAAIRKVLNT